MNTENSSNPENIDDDILQSRADIIRARQRSRPTPGASTISSDKIKKIRIPRFEELLTGKRELIDSEPQEPKPDQIPASEINMENIVTPEEEKALFKTENPIEPADTQTPENKPVDNNEGMDSLRQAITEANKQTPSIPKFDLAQKILSEQRMVASKRRQRPKSVRKISNIMPSIKGLVGKVIEENKKTSAPKDTEKTTPAHEELAQTTLPEPVKAETIEPAVPATPEPNTAVNTNTEDNTVPKIELEPAEPVEIKHIIKEVKDNGPEEAPESVTIRTLKKSDKSSYDKLRKDLDLILDGDLDVELESLVVPIEELKPGVTTVSEIIIPPVNELPMMLEPNTTPRPENLTCGIVKNAGHLNISQQLIISEIVTNDIELYCRAS